MSQNKWTDIQRHRVNILFKHHPILKRAYTLAMELRRIFNAKISPTKAMGRINRWYEKVMALGNNNFRSVIKTFKNHAPTILNYFRRRATNASAEAFNSKVKSSALKCAVSETAIFHLPPGQTVCVNI